MPKIIDEIVQDIAEDSIFAVGLDMAASEENWGLCVLEVSHGLETAKLRLLLPRPKVNQNGQPSPTLLCKPNVAQLARLLTFVRAEEKSGALAVDVPFGWPTDQSFFLNHWNASHGWPGEELRLIERDNFERRFCDRSFRDNQNHPNITPLSVGADKIAAAAFRWAELRKAILCELIGSIDVGLDEFSRSSDGAVHMRFRCQVYDSPGAVLFEQADHGL